MIDGKIIIVLATWLVVAEAEAGGAEPAGAKPPASGSRFASLFDDPVIARGQGVQVKQSELEEAFISFKANLAARGQSVPEEQRLFREAQLLERLIVTQILTKRATNAASNRWASRWSNSISASTSRRWRKRWWRAN
jgi:hypothetical protein